MKRTASFAIALLAGTGLPTLATDLGTLGPTYEIAEPHLLRMIEERLRLHPTWTSFYEVKGSGHLSSYDDDPDGYTEALLDFLQKWFPAAN